MKERSHMWKPLQQHFSCRHETNIGRHLRRHCWILLLIPMAARGWLTCLIKYTSGEAKELVKIFLYLSTSEGYKETIKMINEGYRDPHKILAAYRKKTKDWPIVRTYDAGRFSWSFNFLIKCCSLVSNKQLSPLINSLNMICMPLTKLPNCVQDRLHARYNNSTANYLSIVSKSFWYLLL